MIDVGVDYGRSGLCVRCGVIDWTSNYRRMVVVFQKGKPVMRLLLLACLTLLAACRNESQYQLAQQLHQAAVRCRDQVMDFEPYSQSFQCRPIEEIALKYLASSDKRDLKTELLFSQALNKAWEALVISNALHPDDIQTRLY